MTKEYYQAHKEEIRAKKMAYASTPEAKERARARRAKYDKTEKAAAKRARYYASEKGKATLARHDAKRKVTPERMLKSMAQHKVAYALRKGKLVKEECAVCGNAKSVAHHHLGYNDANLLNVKWLCQKHHTEAHMIMTENEVN